MSEFIWPDVKVGDGVTVTLYTDRQAYTVIDRTAKSLTLQRDKAIKDPNFKPEWVTGGFSAICLNSEEQDYTYEPNLDGEIVKAYYSKRKGSFYVDKYLRCSKGRHEYYDYNF